MRGGAAWERLRVKAEMVLFDNDDDDDNSLSTFERNESAVDKV